MKGGWLDEPAVAQTGVLGMERRAGTGVYSAALSLETYMQPF